MLSLKGVVSDYFAEEMNIRLLKN